MKKIAFDFDGVIADTDKKKINWIKENIGITLEYGNKSSFYQELSKYYSKDQVDNFYKKMSTEIFTTKVLTKTKPIKKSTTILKKISKNHEIYIITARPISMFKDLNAWLTANKINYCITKIISSSNSDKQTICLDNNISFLCDDDIRHLKDNKIKTRVYFNYNLNDKNRSDKIKIVKNWDDIYSLLIGGNKNEL